MLTQTQKGITKGTAGGKLGPEVMLEFVGRGEGRTLGGHSFAHTPLVLVGRSRVRSLRHPQGVHPIL